MPARRRLLPLVFSTMATQTSIVVLVPIVVEVGRDLDASVSAVGQARSILAATAVAVAFAVGPLIDRIGVRPLLLWGGALALSGAGLSAAAPSLVTFYLAQVPAGAGVACLLSAGFAGVAAYFADTDAPWAMGYVVGAQSIAWIAGNPLIGVLTDAVSWRLAYAVPAAVAAAALVGGLAAPRVTRRTRRNAGERTAGTPEAGASGEHDAVTRAEPVGGDGLRGVLRDRSARRWAVAELVAYSAWTAELTYAGAFYIQTYGAEESTVGWLLAIGSLAFMLSTLWTAALSRRVGQRRLIVGGALGMGLLLVPALNVTPSVWFTVGIFCVLAVFAGVRSTGSSVLGLSQLPARPGSMMAARTASAQLGYMIGAVAGGAVLAVADFGVLGFVLFAGMAFSALLIARVSYPRTAGTPIRGALPQPVPD